jgi:hypothetical protein
MKRLCLSIIPLLLLASLSGVAQTVTGAIRGIITDPTGAIVPTATVTAINTATGVPTVAKTNQAGEYAIRFLQIGQYKLTVEAPGFTTAKYGPFALEIDQVAKIDIPLTVGANTTTVEVSDQLQPILNTENATLGETFTENTINNVPLNGRDFSQLTVFTPGAVSTGYGMYGQQNSVERSTNANNEADVNGSRQQSNNYLLDGQEINENLNNTIGYTPSPDSLEQIRVISSNANAEFGNVNGGDVVMVTKSGSNQFHGTVFGFLENDKLNANSWTNDGAGLPKTGYTQALFGGTFGGPIIKDKLFFFIDYEGLREHSSGLQLASVAPAAFRTGDLSLVKSALGIQLYDSQTIGPDGQPVAFLNNQIPVLNPVAQFLFNPANVKAYPLPNIATSDPSGILNNFAGPGNSTEKNDQGDVKIDYHFRSNDIISGRYSQGTARDATVTDPIPVFFPSASNYPDHLATGTWTHTFSPAIINSFRGSYARIRFNSGVTTDPSGIFGLNGNSVVGIPGPPQQTAGFSLQSFNGQESGPPGPGSAGSPQNGALSSFGANPTPEIFIDNVFEYSENLTWQRGRHLLKFGAEFTRYQQNSFYPGNDGELGDFTYTGGYTSNPFLTAAPGYQFADFILDRVNNVQVGQVTGRTGQRQWRDAVFAQDDFKVMPNLTLNIGVRWSFDQPIYEVNNKMANLNLQTGAILYAGVDGNSRALYDAVYNQFQPRLGFAYSATPRLVIRGGYGITSYLEGSGANLRLTQNPPFHNDFEQQGQNPTGSDASDGSPAVPYSPGVFFKASDGFPTTVPPTTTFYAWKKHLQPAVTQEASLTAEYELTSTTALSAGYVLILGQHLIDPQFGNQLTSPTATAPYANVVGQTGVVKITGSDSDSNYNALQATIRQRLRGGLELTANYTYSKALTNDFGFYGVSNSNSGQYYQQNAYDFNSEYGPAAFDVRHALNVTGVYELPFGRGKRFLGNANRAVDEVIGGWKLSGSNVSYSGFPFTVNSPSNYSSLVYAFTGAARPDQNIPLKVVNRSVNAWFGTNVQTIAGVQQPGYVCGPNQNNGTCVFSQQPNNGFGNVRPFSLRAPGYEQIDMSLQKSFAIFREHALDFRVDGFNLFNIASYGTPDANITDNNFGQITSTNSTERHLQLSLKYKF